MRTLGDAAKFMVDQEAALGLCESKRAELVAIVDAANQAGRRKPWWRF